MKFFSTTFLLFYSCCLFAQTDIDTLFSGFVEGQYKKLKTDSLGYYYIIKRDTTKILFWSKNESYIKMYDLKNNLLLEGSVGYRVCSQLVSKAGKWISYYPTGIKKTEGYYLFQNQRAGLWKHYYSNGQLEKIYTLGSFEIDSVERVKRICMVGTYEEYYDNGNLKASGIYGVNFVPDSVDLYPEYDTSGNVLFIHKLFTKVPRPIPTGPWYYYKENGELLRKELY
jgi:MORN repeat variant